MEKIGIYKDYVVIDTEFIKGQIIEIAAVKIRNGIISDKFVQLIKPKIKIDGLNNFNDITDYDLENAPAIEEVLSDYLSFIGEDLIVGHNVKSSDISKIKKHCEDLGLPFENECICTLEMAKNANIEFDSYSLQNIGKYFGLGEEKHRALDDCIHDYHVYEILKHIPSKSDTLNEPIKEIKNATKKQSKNYPEKRRFDIFKREYNVNPVSDLLQNKRICFTNCDSLLTDDLARKMYLCGFKSECLDENIKISTNLCVYNLHPNGEKTGKCKKAENYKEKGRDISTIEINTFIKMIDGEINGY